MNYMISAFVGALKVSLIETKDTLRNEILNLNQINADAAPYISCVAQVLRSLCV